MMKTSSERSVWKSVLRNSAPSTGTSPRPGRALILLVTLFLIKPPMAKLWPSSRCTVVVARRVVNEGRMAVVEMPVAVMPMPSLFRSDTSGDTFRLMRPPSSTVGVNLTATPNSFSSSVIVGVPPLLVWLTGMKILPPARKLASWPLMAMMFGSASTLIRPSRFCASRLKKLFLLAPLKPLGLLLNRLDSSEYAQLVDQGFRYLRHFDFQHHLLRRGDRHQVDHARRGSGSARGVGWASGGGRGRCASARRRGRAGGRTRTALGIGVRQRHRLVGLDGIADHARQDQRVASDRHVQVFLVRQQCAQARLQQAAVDADGQVDDAGLVAAVPDDQVGGADRFSQQIDIGGIEQDYFC